MAPVVVRHVYIPARKHFFSVFSPLKQLSQLRLISEFRADSFNFLEDFPKATVISAKKRQKILPLFFYRKQQVLLKVECVFCAKECWEVFHDASDTMIELLRSVSEAYKIVANFIIPVVSFGKKASKMRSKAIILCLLLWCHGVRVCHSIHFDQWVSPNRFICSSIKWSAINVNW